MNNLRKPISPFSIIIFGATGDLAHRKILPAFYALAQQGRLPEQFHIIGFARRDWTDEIFRAEMRQGVEHFGRIPFDAAMWDHFGTNLHYHRSEFDQADGYSSLRELLDRLGPSAANRLFYLAPPPETYSLIVHQLGEVGLNHSADGWARLIIEKP